MRARLVRTRTELGTVAAATGEAERATTQTVHRDSSAKVEWWCAVKMYADHNVNSKQNHAMRLEAVPMTHAYWDIGFNLHRTQKGVQALSRLLSRL